MKLHLSTVLSLLFIFSFNNFSQAGNEGAYGGDTYALEFISLGGKIAKALNNAEASLLSKWGLSTSKFKEAVNSVRVVSAEGSEVVLNGAEVDAINYPDRNEILMNRTRWREGNLKSRLKIVLHEYFGILNIERNSYEASLEFAPFIGALAKNLAKNSSSEINLFYGRCLAVPSLSETGSMCDANSEKVQKAEACAKFSAEGKCRLEKNNCELISLDYEVVISTVQIGLRYCEVTAIIK